MIVLTEGQRDALENLEWKIYEDEKNCYVEIYKYSPAGEDFSCCIWVETPNEFAAQLGFEADDFDVDDHIDLWADKRGRKGVPATYRELLEDAEAIKQMLKEAADAVNAVDLMPAIGEDNDEE